MAKGERMRKVIEFKKTGEWVYLFCENERDGLIVSDTRGNALPAHAFDYFVCKFEHIDFRIA